MPLTYSLPRCTPEEQGISSNAVTDFIATVEKTIHSLHSFMLLRSGQVIAEGWWHPWRAETPHMLFSLSKSFTSTAVGMLAAEGRLTVEDTVLSFFPNEAPKKVSPNLAAMIVHHLLSMSTGHDLDTTDRVFSRRNPIKAFLSLPVEHAPGTHFAYNSAASYMLSAIVQRLTGETLLEYLTPRLFEPLGIIGATWESHPNGINFGGWGLKIKTEDIARFGQLYLQKGVWNGQCILPEAWVETATAKQVSNGNDPNDDWAQGYGYQFWRCRHNSYRGDGAFGQFCIIMSEQRAVLAMTAGVADMQPVLNLVWEKLLPWLRKDLLPADGASQKTLIRTCERLNIRPPQGASTSAMAGKVSGRTYRFEPNYERLKNLRFDFGTDICTVTYELLGGGNLRGIYQLLGAGTHHGTEHLLDGDEWSGIHELKCGYGAWQEGTAVLGVPAPECVAASGVWTGEETFTLTLCQYETPFINTITCRFEGDRLFYDFKPNVAFGTPEFPQLVGTTE